MGKVKNLQDILDADLCTGCGFCEAISGPGAISMEYSAEGYLRPRVKEPISDREDKMIAAVCPGHALRLSDSDAPRHTIWGPLITSRTGYAANPELRYKGASGGALSAVLDYLLDSGKVDFIAQTVASGSSPILNEQQIGKGLEDIIAAAGSRYAPSAPLAPLPDLLKLEGRFAFVGKPCDIAAIRAYMTQRPEIRDRVPYLISFFCAGIPSVRSTETILERLGVVLQDLASFRYRGEGWPGRAKATTLDGQERSMSYAESWGDILSHSLQFRCKICPDGSGGFADIVFGDPWYGDESGYPDFEERDGRSLILTRTETGEGLLNDTVAAGSLVVEPLDADEIEKMQPYQAKRKRLTLSRITAMKLLGRGAPTFTGLSIFAAAKEATIWANARSFLGMVRRLLWP